jgi:hypothetical protein
MFVAQQQMLRDLHQVFAGKGLEQKFVGTGLHKPLLVIGVDIGRQAQHRGVAGRRR